MHQAKARYLDQLRVFPPSGFFQHVLPAIAIDVADAESVIVFFVTDVLIDGVEFPRLRRVLRIEFGVTELSAGVKDQLRPAVAGQIRQRG